MKSPRIHYSHIIHLFDCGGKSRILGYQVTVLGHYVFTRVTCRDNGLLLLRGVGNVAFGVVTKHGRRRGL